MKTLNSYLIDYHRPTGKVTCTHYSSSTEATRERIRRNRANTDPDREILVIRAQSEEALRRSHSRYFMRENLHKEEGPHA